MKSGTRISTVLKNLLRKKQVERQLDDELRAYVDLVTDENVAAGIAPQEARRRALAEFGGVEQVKQAVRDRRTGTAIMSVWQDVRYGLRQLARNKAFTAAVVVTLAFSVGANTAIFSIVNALMLKSLPYPEPERLGTIFMRVQGSNPYDGQQDIDGEQWELLRDNVPSLVPAVSGGMSSGVNLQAGRNIQYVHAGRVSAHYLDGVFGIHAMLGRTFAEEEDRPAGPRAVVLSYDLWRTAFNADPDL